MSTFKSAAHPSMIPTYQSSTNPSIHSHSRLSQPSNHANNPSTVASTASVNYNLPSHSQAMMGGNGRDSGRDEAIRKLIHTFIMSIAQVIVESRSVLPNSDHLTKSWTDLKAPPNKSLFRVDVKSCNSVSDRIETDCFGNWEPQHADFSLTIDISLSAEPLDKHVLLERWLIKFSNKMSPSHSNPNLLYKRMTIQIRSLLSYLRLLPTHEVVQSWESTIKDHEEKTMNTTIVRHPLDETSESSDNDNGSAADEKHSDSDDDYFTDTRQQQSSNMNGYPRQSKPHKTRNSRYIKKKPKNGTSAAAPTGIRTYTYNVKQDRHNYRESHATNEAPLFALYPFIYSDTSEAISQFNEGGLENYCFHPVVTRFGSIRTTVFYRSNILRDFDYLIRFVRGKNQPTHENLNAFVQSGHFDRESLARIGRQPYQTKPLSTNSKKSLQPLDYEVVQIAEDDDMNVTNHNSAVKKRNDKSNHSPSLRGHSQRYLLSKQLAKNTNVNSSPEQTAVPLTTKVKRIQSSPQSNGKVRIYRNSPPPLMLTGSHHSSSVGSNTPIAVSNSKPSNDHNRVKNVATVMTQLQSQSSQHPPPLHSGKSSRRNSLRTSTPPIQGIRPVTPKMSPALVQLSGSLTPAITNPQQEIDEIRMKSSSIFFGNAPPILSLVNTSNMTQTSGKKAHPSLSIHNQPLSNVAEHNALSPTQVPLPDNDSQLPPNEEDASSSHRYVHKLPHIFQHIPQNPISQLMGRFKKSRNQPTTTWTGDDDEDEQKTEHPSSQSSLHSTGHSDEDHALFIMPEPRTTFNPAAMRSQIAVEDMESLQEYSFAVFDETEDTDSEIGGFIKLLQNTPDLDIFKQIDSNLTTTYIPNGLSEEEKQKKYFEILCEQLEERKLKLDKMQWEARTILAAFETDFVDKE